MPEIVARGSFDRANKRHRRILDESAPLDDPVFEDARRRAVGDRRRGSYEHGYSLREFARLVAERGGVGRG